MKKFTNKQVWWETGNDSLLFYREKENNLLADSLE